jgi:alanyl-tRNA synthetase
MARRRASAPATKAHGWSADRIRKTFLRFFEERGHKVVPSAPLVPFGDPTLLFTTAGMVQFKPYFEGRAQPPSRRLTTVQKCFRTSDIDSVGDASHLTFFEMLGNFSVGDPSASSGQAPSAGSSPEANPPPAEGQSYFKEGAIPWAWELVTEVIGLPRDRLWAAVSLDDDEAFDLWRKVGVPAERIMHYGEEDNYWFSGDIGPCGPCSEIYYDFGPTPGCPECEKGACHPQVDCRDEYGAPRFLELWNLVFMTYFQHEDGSRTELPGKNIDTGAGLERWAAVLLYESQEWKDKSVRPSVYDTDLFRPIIARVEELSGRRYGEDAATDRAMRIVAEHARAAAFLIADGVMPSNEGRGYVLRRIMRRAVYMSYSLGRESAILGDVVGRAMDTMAGAYPGLVTSAKVVVSAAEAEEKGFRRTVGRGREVLVGDFGGAPALLKDVRENLRDAPLHRATWATKQTPLEEMLRSELLPTALKRELLTAHRRLLGPRPWEAALEDLQRAANLPLSITGPAVFLLWDTYGFPPELTKEIALSAGFGMEGDVDGDFNRLVDAQRERARAASRFGGGLEEREKAYAALSHLHTRFVGYETLRHESTVAAIIAGADVVESAQEGDEVEIVLHETPFYAEGGGQVGDQGEIVGPAGRFAVEDTQWAREGVAVHRGRVVEGRIAVNDAVVAQVDAEKRRDTMRNHTATHLLQAALRRVLGTHVRQSGSLVAPDRLRFDFTHMEALKPEEVLAVQRLVNDKIREDIEVHPAEKGYEEAIAGGALAFFGEKYADRVRVVEIAEQPGTEEHAGLPAGQAGPSEGRYSMELCGGTHCRSTGEIGSFIIVREESIGAGLRRIEAVTGRGAEEYVQAQRDVLERLSRRVGVTPADLETKVASLLEELEAERRRAQALEREAARRAAEALLSGAERIDGAAVVAGQVPAASFEVMRETGDWLRDRLGSAVLVLGAVFGERPNFVAMITPDLTARGLHAGELVKRVAAVTGGGGGGRPEMAQAGGKDPARLEEALGLARKLARESLSALPPGKGSPSPPASAKGGSAAGEGGRRAGKGR